VEGVVGSGGWRVVFNSLGFLRKTILKKKRNEFYLSKSKMKCIKREYRERV
jgi:hypothetical protein